MRNSLSLIPLLGFVMSGSIILGQSTKNEYVEIIDSSNNVFSSDIFYPTDYERYINGKVSVESDFSGIRRIESVDAISCIYNVWPWCGNHDTIKCDIELTYENGSLVKSVSYYKNRHKKEELNFNSKGKHGTHIKYFRDGQVEAYTNYVNGTRMAPDVGYYPSGSQRYIAVKVNKHWSELEFFENGLLCTESWFLNPISSTKIRQRYYDSNGRVTQEVIEGAGIQDFIEVSSEDTLIYGRIKDARFLKVGKWKVWYDNGNIKLEAVYNDSIPNLPVGTWKYYNEQGKLIKEEIYEGGELKETQEYSPINLGKKD